MTHRNLVTALRAQAERLGPRTALRFKRYGLYHDLGWQEYHQAALACAAALQEAGIRQGDRVGIWGENSVDWLIADLGILAVGAVNVPPHAPLTARQVHYELTNAGVRWLFVSNQEQLEKVRQIRGELPDLSGIVVFDQAASTDEALGWAGFTSAAGWPWRDAGPSGLAWVNRWGQTTWRPSSTRRARPASPRA